MAKIRFRHAEVDGQSSKKSKKKKWCKGCISRFLSEKVLSMERGKKEPNHTVKFSKGTWHHIQIPERKGPSRGVIQKCEPHERNPCAPKFAERTQDDAPRKMRLQSSMGLGEKCL